MIYYTIICYTILGYNDMCNSNDDDRRVVQQLLHAQGALAAALREAGVLAKGRHMLKC